MGSSDARITLIRLASVLVVYTVAARVCLAFASIGDTVTLIWAPTGIALGAVLRWGPRMAVAVGVGNVLAGFTAGSPIGFSLWAGAGASIEVLLGAALMTRVGRFRGRFESMRDVLVLIGLGAFPAAAVAGAIGATGLGLFGMISWGAWVESAGSWWIGDAMGVLIVAPVLITWPDHRDRPVTRSRAFEGGILALALTATGIGVFHFAHLRTPAYPIAYLLIPGVLWAAYRFRPFGASLAALWVAVLAISGTLREEGPFLTGSRDESLWLMFGYLGVISAGGLLIAALIAARERTERDLRENQSWLGMIEHSAGVGTWVWDPNAATLQGSEQQHRLYGVSADEEPIGMNNIAEFIAPEDLERVRSAAETAIQTRGSIDVEFRTIWPDGSVHWNAAKGRCVPVDPSRPDGPFRMVGMNLDISDRKHVDESLRRNERLASLGTLAAGTAHEINNPLGTILLAARTAQQALDDPETVRSALEDIIDDTRRTAQIVKNLLHFARSGDSEHSRVDLNACISRASDLCRPYSRQRSVSLDLDLSDEALEISGNATELEQVFVNLLRNAIESSKEQSTVVVESYRTDDRIHAAVTDRGRGIPESDLPRIFDPFFTTRAGEGGSGLGLSICHGIVEAHGGALDVASQPQVGTTVNLTLPCSPGEERDPVV